MDELKREIGRDEFDLVLSPIELESLSGRSALRFVGIIEAADTYFALLEERRGFFALKRKLRSHLLARLKQRRDLFNKLARELDKFSNGEAHQRCGDLLLANLSQAVKTAGGFLVTDFYDEAQPLIEIPSTGIPTPQEAAAAYFKLARKARRGFEKVSARLPQVENEIAQLEKYLAELDAGADASALNSLAAQLNLPAPEKKPAQPAKKEEKIPGVRRYRSSDGYEIMVGRAGADNDHLTFRPRREILRPLVPRRRLPGLSRSAPQPATQTDSAALHHRSRATGREIQPGQNPSTRRSQLLRKKIRDQDERLRARTGQALLI
jgi:predicted ribosome quality control (RQC) complex YloA/Tae2 family protein